MMASRLDLLATLAVRFVIALGVFLFGITALGLGRQGWRACARCWRRCVHG